MVLEVVMRRDERCSRVGVGRDGWERRRGMEIVLRERAVPARVKVRRGTVVRRVRIGQTGILGVVF